MLELSKKRNGRRIEVRYPARGTSNVYRNVKGVKLRSGTGPNGKFITVQEDNGKIRSLSLNKVAPTF